MRFALVVGLVIAGGAEAVAAPCVRGDRVDQAAFLCAAKTEPLAAELGDILVRLPPRFRKNFTLKHGARRPGERGHTQDAVEDSTSARPSAMRVVGWDETTGFTFSFDGTPPAADASPRAKRGARRVGMLSVDRKTGAFTLSAIDLPLRADGDKPIAPYQPTIPEDDCHLCHGPDSRPIWPMYPDWPGFIGSDNDEVSRDTPTQREELAWLRDARLGAGKPGDRLAALFAPELDAYFAAELAGFDRDAIRKYLTTRPRPTPGLRAAATADDATLGRWLGLYLHERFPYRPDHELQLAEASRALSHRPNSRVGMLYNRLQARWLMKRIRKSAYYQANPALVALTVMDCGGPAGERILYPVLLASLGLTVRDVDIRLAYRSAEYARFDGPYPEATLARTVMDLGYIPYPGGPSPVSGATLFWNAYFDGSASVDELLALAMVDELAAKDRALKGLYRPMSLGEKYGEVTARYAMDRPFFAEMDRLGRWLPLPYPSQLLDVHHRDPYAKGRSGRYAFPVEYGAVCARLRELVGGGDGSVDR